MGREASVVSAVGQEAVSSATIADALRNCAAFQTYIDTDTLCKVREPYWQAIHNEEVIQMPIERRDALLRAFCSLVHQYSHIVEPFVEQGLYRHSRGARCRESVWIQESSLQHACRSAIEHSDQDGN